MSMGIPLRRDLGLVTGVPPPQKGPGTSDYSTPRKDIRPVEVSWDRGGVTPPPGVARQTPVKTVPSPFFGCGR